MIPARRSRPLLFVRPVAVVKAAAAMLWIIFVLGGESGRSCSSRKLSLDIMRVPKQAVDVLLKATTCATNATVPSPSSNATSSNVTSLNTASLNATSSNATSSNVIQTDSDELASGRSAKYPLRALKTKASNLNLLPPKLKIKVKMPIKKKSNESSFRMQYKRRSVREIFDDDDDSKFAIDREPLSCKDYRLYGSCAFGDTCKFAHIRPTLKRFDPSKAKR
mmetsp:Transcript_12734/g.23117  ORF Transcript_12734/g.23117 Transcript_12734/m.23117 type:complete len:221 (-) Transcript_12734:215-877(-)